jgi:hypothetical protein
MKPLAIALTFIGLVSSAANATADDVHSALKPMPKSLEIRFQGIDFFEALERFGVLDENSGCT